MDSKELYTALLGIRTPWTVERVDMDMARTEIVVAVGHPPGSTFPCPRCERQLAVYDHAEERRWRHLDSCQFLTFLVARPPRVQCPDHGRLQVALPWAESGSRFTTMFEALAIDLLQACNVKRAAQLLCISWDEAWGLMERAVRRGLERKTGELPRYIGVDEKAIAKRHQYMTIVSDLETGRVDYVGEGRGESSLVDYYLGLSPAQRQGIEAVSMDMWQAYMSATRRSLAYGGEKIVFDRFHVMQQVLRAVDQVRRRETRDLRAEGDTTLTGTKYLWLSSTENLTVAAAQRFAAVRDTNLKTARAWAMKEQIRMLWWCADRDEARALFQRWYFWATHSRLKPMIEAARTLQRHLHNILTYYAHPITNAVAEGLNSKIAGIQKRSCGFRNRNHFKIAIYFHCGGLDLSPTV